MPYIVPNKQGTFGAGARGFTAYDSKGNYWGYFPNGKIPQCSATSYAKNPNCPVGALKPWFGFNPNCCGNTSTGCYRNTVTTCPTGYTCVSKSYAPWASCNINKGILF